MDPQLCDGLRVVLRPSMVPTVINRPRSIISPISKSTSTTSKCAGSIQNCLKGYQTNVLMELGSPAYSLGAGTVVKTLHHSESEATLFTLLTLPSPAPPSTVTLLNTVPSLPLSNGHTSPLANSTLTNDDAPYDSESDLSDVAIPIVDEPSPATTSNHQSEFGAHDTDDSDSSPAEAQDESDDADFDMEESPAPAAANGANEDSSTSTESRRPAKRKIGLEDEIQANPELYGLRRSVRSYGYRCFRTTILTCVSRVVLPNTKPLYVAGPKSTTLL
jgi:hypothetical protein